MRTEIRCKKCHKLLFVVTSDEANISGVEIKCTRCKHISVYNSQGEALNPTNP